jgi:hypothetical protein
MGLRISLAVLALILVSGLSTSGQNGSSNPTNPSMRTKQVETCEHFCYGLIIKGRLINTFEFSKCDAISGMTCHIALKKGAQLPSRVFMQALDSQDRPLGKRRLLIYPELKEGEGGWATFLGTPNNAKVVVLTGEWNGPYIDLH